MSIKGIVFDYQIPTAKQMASVFRQRFNDGRVSGCEVTASGGTAYIAPGILMACGRPFELTAQETVALSGSGYNHIICSLDTSEASTGSTFDQVSISVIADGSAETPALTQEDINSNGTLYQFEVACVQVSNGSAVAVTRGARMASALREGIDYGTTLPSSGHEGQLFIKLEG